MAASTAQSCDELTCSLKFLFCCWDKNSDDVDFVTGKGVGLAHSLRMQFVTGAVTEVEAERTGHGYTSVYLTLSILPRASPRMPCPKVGQSSAVF